MKKIVSKAVDEFQMEFAVVSPVFECITLDAGLPVKDYRFDPLWVYLVPILVHTSTLDEQPEILDVRNILIGNPNNLITKTGDASEHPFLTEFDECFSDGGLADLVLFCKHFFCQQ